jgi:hypothetical protein
MRENRLSGLMRGGKQTVIGPRASQSVASRLLYTPGVFSPKGNSLADFGAKKRIFEKRRLLS